MTTNSMVTQQVDCITFTLNDKEASLFCEWDSSDGDKWTFDLILDHPDIGYSLQGHGGDIKAVTRILNDLAGELSISPTFVEPLAIEIELLVRPLYMDAPSNSPGSSYFGR